MFYCSDCFVLYSFPFSRCPFWSIEQRPGTTHLCQWRGASGKTSWTGGQLVLVIGHCMVRPLVPVAFWCVEPTVQHAARPLKLLAHSIPIMTVTHTGSTCTCNTHHSSPVEITTTTKTCNWSKEWLITCMVLTLLKTANDINCLLIRLCHRVYSD